MHRLLLDEVNLASPEIMERVAPLLEEGDTTPQQHHPEAMTSRSHGTSTKNHHMQPSTHRLLLDEVNLASPETLERVAPLLEEGGSLALTEKGEATAVPRHPRWFIQATCTVCIHACTRYVRYTCIHT